jgi:putative ABC transport system permease protein
MTISRHDVRLAFRQLLRHRTFTIAAVLSLGLAIALNTTMYAVIDALIQPRVDGPHPERLFSLMLTGDTHNRVDAVTRNNALRSGFRTYDALSSVNGVSYQPFAFERGQRFTQASIAYVAPNIFSVLEIKPIAGRAFTDADYLNGSAPIVITEVVARELFAPGESPIGASIDVNGTPHPVIAVIGDPRHLPIPRFQAWMLPPPTMALTSLPLNVIRLRAGSTPQDAERELSMIASRLGEFSGLGALSVALRLAPMRPPQFHILEFHIALIAAVLAVLLIACANLANLQLARGLGRNRELALRTALGATRRAIVGQLLLESGVLAFGGFCLGILLTVWSSALLRAHIPPAVSEYIVEPQTSWRVFAVALGAMLVCLVIVGLIPAIQVSNVDPNTLLKSGAGTGANRRNRHRYSLMIAAEIGLSLALLSGMALLVRRAASIGDVDVGFDMKPIVQAMLKTSSPPGTTARFVDVQRSIHDQLQGVPGVDGIAVVMGKGLVDNSVTLADVDGEKRELLAPTYGVKVVTPDYLRTLRIPLSAGRDFSDGLASEGELIIDEPTARYLWPNGRAVGGMIKLGSDSSHAPWVRVVGVVHPVRQLNAWTFSHPEDAAPQGFGVMYYRPSVRDSLIIPSHAVTAGVYVRATRDADRLTIALRRALSSAQDLTVMNLAPLEEGVGLRAMRLSYDFVAQIFSLFTVLAVGLAALGIHGIVTHAIVERRRELGVRIALGASTRDILSAVLRDGNAVALAGVAFGLLLTKYTVQWLRAFSVENDRYDAPLFAEMAAVLFAIALIAALLPAFRATRIDPVEAIRSE